MRAVADDALPATAGFAHEMFFCLGCLACQSVCPADVQYAELIEYARAEAVRSGAAGKRGFWRSFFLKVLFTSRPRIRWFGRLLRFYQRSGMRVLLQKSGLLRLLGRRRAELEAFLPRISREFTPQGRFQARGHPKYRVGLLAGCVQDIAFAEVNRDTLSVLQANGCEVLVPPAQQCCGSLHGHNGDLETAGRLARANIDAFPVEDLDAVIVNSAGCGSFMKHYDRLLAEDIRYRERAAAWSKKVRDIAEFLVEVNFRKPGAAVESRTVTYHDACHLCHGQKIRTQPREVLRAVPGIKLVELPESEWCCGSAGIYNITHPELANQLLERKMRNIAGTGASIVACGNPGCAIQIQQGAARSAIPLTVRHPVSLLAEAYRRETRP